MKKKLLCIILMAVMVVALLPVTAFAGIAEDVGGYYTGTYKASPGAEEVPVELNLTNPTGTYGVHGYARIGNSLEGAKCVGVTGGGIWEIGPSIADTQVYIKTESGGTITLTSQSGDETYTLTKVKAINEMQSAATVVTNDFEADLVNNEWTVTIDNSIPLAADEMWGCMAVPIIPDLLPAEMADMVFGLMEAYQNTPAQLADNSSGVEEIKILFTTIAGEDVFLTSTTSNVFKFKVQSPKTAYSAIFIAKLTKEDGYVDTSGRKHMVHSVGGTVIPEGATHVRNQMHGTHIFGTEYKVDKEPTCTEAGSKSKHCTICDAKDKDNPIEIPALGHDFATEFTVDKKPTCTEAGSESIHCSRCDEKKDVTEIPALGHDWDEEYTVDKEATCTEAGSKSIHCKRCDERKDVTEIPAGHDWEAEYTIDKAPTKEAEGSKSIHCKRCDAKKDVQAIPRIKPVPTDKINTKQPIVVVAKDAFVKAAGIVTTVGELANSPGIFTEEEKQQIRDGKSANIWLQIDKQAAKDYKPEEWAKVVKSAESFAGTGAHIECINIDLLKQLEGASEPTKVHEPGIPIEISIQIPDEFLSKDGTMKREFCLVRMHDGEAALITGTFNEGTKMFTFKTDKFSAYALAYKDTPIKTPETGDAPMTAPYVLLLAAAAAAAAFAIKRRNAE